jgi:hypothetical protein
MVRTPRQARVNSTFFRPEQAESTAGTEKRTRLQYDDDKPVAKKKRNRNKADQSKKTALHASTAPELDHAEKVVSRKLVDQFDLPDDENTREYNAEVTADVATIKKTEKRKFDKGAVKAVVGAIGVRNAAKKREKDAKKAAKKKSTPRPKLEAYTKRINGTLSARGLTCLCGCDAPTHTPDARFISGHDAKLRAAVFAGGMVSDLLPIIIRPFFDNGETVAGLRLDKRAGKLINTKTEESEDEETEE